MWSTQFAPLLTDVTQTRGRAADHLRAQHVPRRQQDDVLLLLSELVTNAVRHGHEPLVLRIDATDDRVRVEVDDDSTAPPRLLPVDLDRTGGMGIRIVDRLSDSWGTCASGTGAGKTVWFEIDLP